MLKTLDETLHSEFMNRAESIVEDVQEKISAESVKAEFIELEKIHKKYFEKSECWFQLSNLGRPAIFFISTVTARKDWYNGYAENDPMKSTFSVTYKKDGKYVIELISGFGLRVKSAPDSTNVYDSVPVSFRKYTGTPAQIIQRYEEWEKKRKNTIDEHVDHNN